MAERLKAPVLKTGKGETPSWVRIPPHPPSAVARNALWRDVTTKLYYAVDALFINIRNKEITTNAFNNVDKKALQNIFKGLIEWNAQSITHY